MGIVGSKEVGDVHIPSFTLSSQALEVDGCLWSSQGVSGPVLAKGEEEARLMTTPLNPVPARTVQVLLCFYIFILGF